MVKLKDIQYGIRPFNSSNYVSTGNTLLNLALTGHPDCGYMKGTYNWIAGESSSGKTFLSLTCFAEAANNPAFENHRLILDDGEGGALMDFPKYFGNKAYNKVEGAGPEGQASTTIEEMYMYINDAIKSGEPFIYVRDSHDALTTEYELKKREEKEAELRGGKKAKADYGDGKAKYNSRYLRGLIDGLAKTDSILIIISQLRDNIDAGMFDDPHVVSGGHALRYYATSQVWSTIGSKKESKEINGKKRKIGANCNIHIKKNRYTGKPSFVKIPILYSVGFDDIGGMVDWLVEEKFWSVSGGRINTKDEFDTEGKKLYKNDFIRYVEDTEGAYEELQDYCQEKWATIEEQIKVTRKSRYE